MYHEIFDFSGFLPSYIDSIGLYDRNSNFVEMTELPLEQQSSRSRPWSVMATVSIADTLLGQSMGYLWIEGEVASVSKAASGHLYFTLKDKKAQLSSVMWSSHVQRSMNIEQGSFVCCYGKLGIYSGSGRFQYYVQQIILAGVGTDARMLAALKKKLQDEGLFDQDRKKPLPFIPTRVGIVTSRVGAALHDIVRIISVRFPVPILIADTLVQGHEAPIQIVRSINKIATHDVDVIILSRGGGSAEELAAFNHEDVVRAIADCKIPVISAVGHETDTSLTDYVADRTASTPSNAAEMVVPVQRDLYALLCREQDRLSSDMKHCFAEARYELEHRTTQINYAIEKLIHHHSQRLNKQEKNLSGVAPMYRMKRVKARLMQLSQRQTSAMAQKLYDQKTYFLQLASRLDAMNPLDVLDRGYSIVTKKDTVIHQASQLSKGDNISIQVSQGKIEATVRKI